MSDDMTTRVQRVLDAMDSELVQRMPHYVPQHRSPLVESLVRALLEEVARESEKSNE